MRVFVSFAHEVGFGLDFDRFCEEHSNDIANADSNDGEKEVFATVFVEVFKVKDDEGAAGGDGLVGLGWQVKGGEVAGAFEFAEEDSNFRVRTHDAFFCGFLYLRDIEQAVAVNVGEAHEEVFDALFTPLCFLNFMSGPDLAKVGGDLQEAFRGEFSRVGLRKDDKTVAIDANNIGFLVGVKIVENNIWGCVMGFSASANRVAWMVESGIRGFGVKRYAVQLPAGFALVVDVEMMDGGQHDLVAAIVVDVADKVKAEFVLIGWQKEEGLGFKDGQGFRGESAVGEHEIARLFVGQVDEFLFGVSGYISDVIN